jgi:hypothetical protein
VEPREVLRLDPDNADAAKALYIAREQAKARPADVQKRPYETVTKPILLHVA